jgi:RNA polymerase sigma-70 factor, ECF subfamily
MHNTGNPAGMQQAVTWRWTMDKPKRESELADSSDRGPARPAAGLAGRRATPAQLSGGRRVTADVSSIALDRLLLAGGSAKGTAELPAGLRGELIEPVVLEMLSDAEVMLRVAAGDDVAFNYLVEKYRRQMISFMYRMTQNQSVAEELAQEVFLRVYRSRQGYAASAKFTTWLYRIATNLAVNYARDTKHERPENMVNLDEPDADTGMTVDLADGSLNAEQVILRTERLAAIRRQVEALPERQRTAVIMHKYQNMDYKQIATVLKLSESATKSLLFRAYETLRETLKQFL